MENIEQYCFLIKLGGAERFSHKFKGCSSPPKWVLPGTPGTPENPVFCRFGTPESATKPPKPWKPRLEPAAWLFWTMAEFFRVFEKCIGFHRDSHFAILSGVKNVMKRGAWGCFWAFARTEKNHLRVYIENIVHTPYLHKPGTRDLAKRAFGVNRSAPPKTIRKQYCSICSLSAFCCFICTNAVA